MATHGVEFADVSFTVSGRPVLREVSLRAEPGTTTALLGRSGSGKTTLLRTVNALVRPTSGRVLLDGHDVAQEDVIALRRGIGYVIQETGLFPHLTIANNVKLPLEVSGRHAKHSAEMDHEAEQALNSVGLPYAQYRDRYPWQLSGGQRQRAGVARALVIQPKVLLMDEPFGALDPLTRAEMQEMVRALLRRTELTALIVTHDLDEALYLADRVVLLEDGTVAADVRSAEVLALPNSAMQAYVQAARRTRPEFAS
ncbi:MAG TPA: ATP-binding cassette domain-containing protein [Acidobacteriaceae bacterium]|jgi:osmoprotectant transport system ATP-binding protein